MLHKDDGFGHPHGKDVMGAVPVSDAIATFFSACLRC